MNQTKQPIHSYLRAVRRKTPLLHKDLAILFNCTQEMVSAYETGKVKIPPHILILYIMICNSSLDKIFRKQTIEAFAQLKEKTPPLIEQIQQEKNGRHKEHRLSFLQTFGNKMDELYL